MTLEELFDDKFMITNYYCLTSGDAKLMINSRPEKLYELYFIDVNDDEKLDKPEMKLDEILELANSLIGYVKLMRSEVIIKDKEIENT